MSARIRAALMLKAPIAGFAKKRLAADIGDKAAVEVYRTMVERQLSMIPKEWETEVYYTPRNALDKMQDWLGSDLNFSAQVDGDLGVKLMHVGKAFFEETDEEERRLVFLGGDCPGASEEALREIVGYLDDADVALGPALDGGYWCLGLSRYVPEVFRDIPWSSTETLSVTKSRLREGSIRYVLGRKLEDVDDLESLKRAEDRIRS